MATLYGLDWGKTATQVEIEMQMIRAGGYITMGGQKYGNGLSYHYETMRKLLWPRLDDHRWHRLCRDSILNNRITVLIGPGSSGKTHEASWIYLVEKRLMRNTLIAMTMGSTMTLTRAAP